jgi:hypothetical protein
LDFDNIGMAMCKLGCDDLYEKGYITVSEGKVKTVSAESFDQSLRTYLEKVDGQACSHWRPQTKGYFEWHSTFTFRQEN